MSPAGGQSGAPDPARWVSVAEAARLTGTDPSTWRRKARQEHARATRGNREPKAIRSRNEAGRLTWYVARDFDGLRATPEPEPREQRESAQLAATYPKHVRELAYRKVYWLDEWRRRLAQPRKLGETARTIAEGLAREAAVRERGSMEVSARTLERWKAEYFALGADGRIRGVEALIDRRGVGRPAGERIGNAGRDPRAVEWFYSLYRTEQKLPAKLCHEATLHEARKHGWAWSPSYAATANWLREHDDKSVSCLLREGKKAWSKRYMPHLEQDHEALSPGELFVSDHHEIDLWAQYKGGQKRPWLTVVQDVRSRCIVGWHVGPAPHQDAILCALRMAFSTWAIPETMRIDRGKDFTSKLFQGLTRQQRNQLRREWGPDWKRELARMDAADGPLDGKWRGIAGELGIRIVEAIPYSPWSKGTVERVFRTVSEGFAKSFATYCGNSTRTRPEGLQDVRAGRLGKVKGDLGVVDGAIVPALQRVKDDFAQWVDIYHQTAHRGLGGATPLAVWKTARSLRKAEGDALLQLMETRGVYRVGANGVRLKVGGATIGYGKSSPVLRGLSGRDVLIAVNPDDVSHCWAYTTDRKPIGCLESNRRIHPLTNADDVREAIAEQLRERNVMHQAGRSSARRMVTAEQRAGEHRRARMEELRKTGTCDAKGSATIVPVQTGFVGVSRASRTLSEPLCDDPRPWHEQLQDLLEDEPEVKPAPMSIAERYADLLPDDDPGTEAATDDEPAPGLRGLL